VIIGEVTITGVNALWLLQALAGDKNLCDNKQIVILSDVILSGFDCIDVHMLQTIPFIHVLV